MMRPLFFLMFSVLWPSVCAAQSGVFETLARGEAVFIAKAPKAPLVTPTVRLDSVCEETDKTGLALQIEDGLSAIGVRVDAGSPIILRYEISPCETEIGRTRSLAKQDAYEGTSRVSELPQPPQQFKYKFGERDISGARLTVNMLVYKPGQPPLWNVLVAGRASGQDTQDYLAQMALYAFQHWGEGGEMTFDIANQGQTSP